MKCLQLTAICLSLMAFGATREVSAAGFTCEPRFQPAASQSLAPHTFFDQAMASITTLYPDHVVLVSRRSSSIAGVNYSLIAYRERGDAAAVRIDGAANLDSKAWVFDLACPANRAMDGLLTLLEQIADLKNLPAAAAGP